MCNWGTMCNTVFSDDYKACCAYIFSHIGHHFTWNASSSRKCGFCHEMYGLQFYEIVFFKLFFTQDIAWQCQDPCASGPQYFTLTCWLCMFLLPLPHLVYLTLELHIFITNLFILGSQMKTTGTDTSMATSVHCLNHLHYLLARLPSWSQKPL